MYSSKIPSSVPVFHESPVYSLSHRERGGVRVLLQQPPLVAAKKLRHAIWRSPSPVVLSLVISTGKKDLAFGSKYLLALPGDVCPEARRRTIDKDNESPTISLDK